MAWDSGTGGTRRGKQAEAGDGSYSFLVSLGFASFWAAVAWFTPEVRLSGEQSSEGRPLGILPGTLAGAADLVAIGPTLRAQSNAVGPAQRLHRHCHDRGLSYSLRYVQGVVVVNDEIGIGILRQG